MAKAIVRKFPFFFVALFLVALAIVSFFLTAQKGTSSDSACGASLSEILDPGANVAVFEDENIDVPKFALAVEKQAVLGESTEERWIEVDLSDQKLKAWEGNSLYLESLVSTGLPWFPTPTGEFRVWLKVRSTRMEGGSGRYYYNLPNVPYDMFIASASVPGSKGYSLHGTYWHNDFGKVHSHGCVNLPTPIAQKLYYWVRPVIPEGKGTVQATSENPGTRVVIHE